MSQTVTQSDAPGGAATPAVQVEGTPTLQDAVKAMQASRQQSQPQIVPDSVPETVEDGATQAEAVGADPAAEGEVEAAAAQTEEAVAATDPEGGDVDDVIFALGEGDDARDVRMSEVQEAWDVFQNYSERTAAIQRDRDAFEAERAEGLNEVQQQLAQVSQALLHWQAMAGTPKQPDPQGAFTDPEQYNRDMAAYNQAVEQQKNANAAFQAAQDRMMKNAEVLSQQQRSAQLVELRTRWPEMAAELEKGGGPISDELYADGATYYGLERARIGNIASAVELEVLRDAIAFRKANGNKPALTRRLSMKARPVKPGAAQALGAEQTRAVKEAQANFAKSGEVADAAKVLRAMRKTR